MKPLVVLIVSFFIIILILKLLKYPIDYLLVARIAMSCMLIFTAIGHFVFSKGMKTMLPDFITYRHEIILITGAMEVFFAGGLLFPKYKFVTAWLLICFLILALPTNIYAAIKQIDYQTGDQNGEGLAYLWFRIPLQLFFIIWVYVSAIASYKP